MKTKMCPACGGMTKYLGVALIHLQERRQCVECKADLIFSLDRDHVEIVPRKLSASEMAQAATEGRALVEKLDQSTEGMERPVRTWPRKRDPE